MVVVSPASSLALSVRDLRKSYGSVVGLDLEVERGECFGLLGPNGAGKTTTIEICEGLTSPDSGHVEVLGRRWSTHERELRELLGIQLQDTQLAEKRRARVGTLSGGQKQRLALACAIVGDPELLFLDEPTTGLDPQSRRQVWELVEQLKAAGRTILLTTHYMDEAERLADRVAIVDRGRVIALGTPRELIASLEAEHVVEFAVTSNGRREGPSLDERALTGVAGVRAARRLDQGFSLRVAHLHETMPAL